VLFWGKKKRKVIERNKFRVGIVNELISQAAFSDPHFKRQANSDVQTHKAG